MEQADFEVMDRLFNVIKSAAEHPGKFPQIVAAAGAKLAEIEAGLAEVAATEKKKIEDEAAAKTAFDAKAAQPKAIPSNAYIPGESEALADANQTSLLDRRA